MSTRTVIYLLRHGEVHNPEGVLYGRLPGFRLSALGEQMAERAAEALADRVITHVMSSPLERAQQTAAPVAARHGLRVSIDDRLIEADQPILHQRHCCHRRDHFACGSQPKDGIPLHRQALGQVPIPGGVDLDPVRIRRHRHHAWRITLGHAGLDNVRPARSRNVRSAHERSHLLSPLLVAGKNSAAMVFTMSR